MKPIIKNQKVCTFGWRRKTICAVALVLLPLVPGCPGWAFPLLLLSGWGSHRWDCPDVPSLTWMVPATEGQADVPSERQISIEGAYAPDAKIIGPQRYGKNCWTNAGLNLDTLQEAVSRASAQAGLVVSNSPQGDRFMLRFEVNRQELSFLIIPLRNYSATVVVSYALSRSDREEPIWKEQISTERVIEYGFAASYGFAAAPPHVGSSSRLRCGDRGGPGGQFAIVMIKLREQYGIIRELPERRSLH